MSELVSFPTVRGDTARGFSYGNINRLTQLSPVGLLGPRGVKVSPVGRFFFFSKVIARLRSSGLTGELLRAFFFF